MCYYATNNFVSNPFLLFASTTSLKSLMVKQNRCTTTFCASHCRNNLFMINKQPRIIETWLFLFQISQNFPFNPIWFYLIDGRTDGWTVRQMDRCDRWTKGQTDGPTNGRIHTFINRDRIKKKERKIQVDPFKHWKKKNWLWSCWRFWLKTFRASTQNSSLHYGRK